MATIILYQDKYQPDFKRLNMEWLEKYGLTEAYDLAILNDPRVKIIDKGGCIFLAVEDEIVIGTAGLAKMGEAHYELIKMAVDPAARGKGIGKLLLNHCLAYAKKKWGRKNISFFEHIFENSVKNV